jgi:HSP20 family protein
MHDISRQSPMRTIMGDLFGFDPLRVMAQPEALGFDIQRTDQGYRLEIPVPGFRPEDINVTVEDRQLTVEGRSERRRFTRAVTLPEEVDADRVEANVENGLLTLTLPLHPKAQPRRIDVKVGGRQLTGTGAGQTGQSGQTAQTGQTIEASGGNGSQDASTSTETAKPS